MSSKDTLKNMALYPDTNHSSQSTDNRSFNNVFEVYEELMYGHCKEDNQIYAIQVGSSGNQLVKISDGTESAEVVIGANTGVSLLLLVSFVF